MHDELLDHIYQGKTIPEHTISSKISSLNEILPKQLAKPISVWDKMQVHDAELFY